MDINALLSPDDNDVSSGNQDISEQTSPQRKPTRVRPGLGSGRRTASGLSNEITRSPERDTTSSSPSRPVSGSGSSPFDVNVAAPNFRPLPPTSNPAQAVAVESPPPHLRYGYAQQIHQRPVGALRQTSTPQIETVADLASMPQRPPPPRAFSANNVRQVDFPDPQRSPLIAPPISRSISRQSLADLTMAEAPAQTPPPRDFTSAALSETESKTITDLLGYLSQNSYAYEQHVELINLLHKGFIAHTFAITEDSDSSTSTKAHSYALLVELRQAREAMDSRFAVGESIWADWLSDEVALASSSDERIATTELFSKAVQDVPKSVKLWLLYIDWISTNFAACYHTGSGNRDWSDDDNELCRELFNKDLLLDVLEQAVAATQWRIDESHLVWNRYAEFVQGEFPQAPSRTDIERLRSVFVQRLQVPHSAWSDTAQMFWSIVSKYEGQDWEALMAMVNEEAQPAKKAMSMREDHELRLQRAIQSNDDEATRAEFERYLKWEKSNKQNRGHNFGYELRCALFERALLKYPTQTDWWLDYIDFATSSFSGQTHSLLPIIERATRYCPWSGDLWGRRILRADFERQPRDDIEATKHRATNSGLLDLGGLEEMVKMLQQWCSYLRRHAFSKANSEDDLDTAEVGLLAALESVKSEGKRLYGPSFQGDPLFRLEQTQIKFLTEARRVSDAREVYRALAKQHSNSFNFWSKYYSWELWLWGYDRMTEQDRVETAENGPHLATAVMQEALNQQNIDRPEMILEMYLYHFQQHESGERLQAALVDARAFSDRLAKKRAREAEEAAYNAAQMQVDEEPDELASNKRKRDDSYVVNGEGNKKAKPEQGTDADQGNSPATASSRNKRDREHNTVTVKNLALDVQETDLRKFFRDCDTILSVEITQVQDARTASAIVEFETSGGVLAAKTRDGKEINGRSIRIQGGGQSTLYVTNYRPEFDENAIRDLFKGYGEVVSVRFPSLKLNSRRLFCYVTFLTSEMANAAEKAMDGTKLDEIHTLVAKVSNPEAAKQRSGAQAEGREVFVKNIDRKTSEDEVKDFFSQFGTVAQVKLLRSIRDQLTGSGFIVYESSEQANNAIEQANNQAFLGRVLHVSLSSPKSGAAPLDRAKKTDIIVKQTSPAVPFSSEKPGSDASPGSRRDSDVSMSSVNHQARDESHKTVRERKAAVFNLSDTVNDVRIRTALEQFGPIVKIQLRRDKEGAIVEFANVNDAFNVRQGVNVSTLGPDVTTGDVGTLLAKPKKNKQGTTNGAGAFLAPPAATRSGTMRGGLRRGGLGTKRQNTQYNVSLGLGGSNNTPSSGAKSNADFRNILAQSKSATADDGRDDE